MSDTIAFLPRNQEHARFFSAVASRLERDYATHAVFIWEIGQIKNHQVFEFERELERIWSEIDISDESLRRYQMVYPKFNFMRAIYSEREFNFFPFYYNDKPINRNHQLKYLIGCFVVFDKWLDQVKIDYVVSELITGIADAVLKEVVEKRNIKYYSVRPSKMTPGIVVCDKYYDEPMDMANYYARFRSAEIPDLLKRKAIDHLAELREKILQPAYMELTKKPFKFITPHKLVKLYKRLTSEKVPVCSVSARRHLILNPIRWAMHKVWNLTRTRMSRDRWFAKSVNGNEKYFIYPLHFEPESSTLVRAFYFSDQLATVKLIAKLLPLDAKLIVKEHGGNQGYRKADFYRELSYMPNVIMLAPGFNVSALIKDCTGVITLTGRMGWEALANRKNVIALGKTFWTSFDGVYRVNSWEEMSNAIEACCKANDRNNDIDENTLLSFAASYIQCIHEGSFVLNGKTFMSDENIRKFCELLISLLSHKSTDR